MENQPASLDFQQILEHVAFEIRNQLCAVLGFTELVQEAVEPQHPAAHNLACLKVAVDRMQLFSQNLDKMLREHRKTTQNSAPPEGSRE